MLVFVMKRNCFSSGNWEPQIAHNKFHAIQNFYQLLWSLVQSHSHSSSFVVWRRSCAASLMSRPLVDSLASTSSAISKICCNLCKFERHWKMWKKMWKLPNGKNAKKNKKTPGAKKMMTCFRQVLEFGRWKPDPLWFFLCLRKLFFLWEHWSDLWNRQQNGAC